MQEGAVGLLRDKTRPSRIPPLGKETTERVVTETITRAESPGVTRRSDCSTASRRMSVRQGR